MTATTWVHCPRLQDPWRTEIERPGTVEFGGFKAQGVVGMADYERTGTAGEPLDDQTPPSLELVRTKPQRNGNIGSVEDGRFFHPQEASAVEPYCFAVHSLIGLGHAPLDAGGKAVAGQVGKDLSV